jgi:hypothetical protein
LIYSLILPSSWFGVVREESGAKLMVPKWLKTEVPLHQGEAG